MSRRSGRNEDDRVLPLLRDLETRISRIEQHLGLNAAGGNETPPSSSSPAVPEDSEDALELRVGQSWFANAGIILLVLGVMFLLTFPYQNLPSFVPSVIGYILVGGILALSRFWKETYHQISRYLLGGGMLLLYFTTLRLSNFSPQPAVTDPVSESVLLCAAVAVSLRVSVRKQSSSLAGLSLTLGFLTALAVGNAWFVCSVILVTSIIASTFAVRFHWNGVLLLGIVLSYLTHLLWSMNIPLFGNPTHSAASHPVILLFILLYASTFAAASLLRASPGQEDAFSIFHTVFNGFESFALLVLLALTVFRPAFAVWCFAASGLYLAIAVGFWVRARSKYTTFVYAMLGYAALSAAIAFLSATPDVFVWLCWQSVLVLATAVWFRSRFIVVANFVIYLMIFIAYLVLAGTIGVISVSFGIVALMSARILNWHKEKLELKTELMRNAYLACALFVLPYALYHVVQQNYVSFSWLGLALFYYIASRFLHNNRKYRWMALLTTLLTVIYVFAVELVGLDPAIRIASFLVLGIALLAVSMIYTRKRRASR